MNKLLKGAYLERQRLTLMPWLGYLKQSLDKIKKIKREYLLQAFNEYTLGSQKPLRGYTQDGRWS